MTYLYGDSTPLPLASNVLEFLRDALDFAVFVLQTDERIEEGRTRIAAIEREAEAELRRLNGLSSVVSRSVDDVDTGPPESTTAQCAAQLKEAIGAIHRASADAVRGEMVASIERVQAVEAAARAECAEALAALLGPHEPPDASTVTRLALVQPGRYEATLSGHAAFGLEWTFELGVRDPWTEPVRVERFAPDLEIRAPQVSGWITKEVKFRPQKLEKYVLTELVVEPGATRFALRADAGSGFDVVAEGDSVSASRAGPGDDAAAGAFEVDPRDASALLEVAKKLRLSAIGFARQTLVNATVDGQDFRAQPVFAAFVQRMVEMLAPIVREIAHRSLTATELIIRRPLADDRREEIFVAKATLREKYAVLDAPKRAIFAPLGLDAATSPHTPPPPRPAPPTARAELAPSVLPPPLSTSRPPPPELSPPHPSTRPPARLPPPPPRAARGHVGPADGNDLQGAKRGPPAPASRPSKSGSPPAAPGAAPPGDSDPKQSGEPANDVLATTLRKIFNVARSGRTEDAYKKYRELYSSPAFAEYKPEEQREALRRMVHAKNTPPKTEAVLETYRIALRRLQALVEAGPEPADYEMLGMMLVHLEKPTAANAAFERALELERARDPRSELCSSLMKRMARPD